MCTKLNDEDLRSAIIEYRSKAHDFFSFAKENFDLPFEELYFIETITAAYELLREDRHIICYSVIFKATYKIISENPNLSLFKVLKKCRDVVLGLNGKEIIFWKEYAESYLKIKYPEKGLRPKINLYMTRKEFDSQLVTVGVHYFSYIVMCCII